jgi:hypothetical protein
MPEQAVAVPKNRSVVKKRRTEPTLAGNSCFQRYDNGRCDSRNFERIIWDEEHSELYLPNCELDDQHPSAKPEFLRPTSCRNHMQKTKNLEKM